MFQIDFDDYNELLALHKTIMSAKFTENPLIPEVQASSYVAKLSFKVFAKIVEASLQAGKTGEVEKWRQWQKADIERYETELLLKALKMESIKKMNDEDRREFIECFMAPLILDPELLIRLVLQKS